MTVHLAMPLKADFVIVKYHNNGTQRKIDDMTHEMYIRTYGDQNWYCYKIRNIEEITIEWTIAKCNKQLQPKYFKKP